MKNVTLLIPGLLGPDTHYTGNIAPRLPALEKLLARADHHDNLTDSVYRLLCDFTDIDLHPDADLPVAALTRLFDDNHPPKGHWMRADPIHLRPERDGLVLMDSFVLGLNRHDALAIAAEVNKVLVHYEMALEIPHEDRWYIRVDEPLDMVTTELPLVVGKDIRRQLPQGADAKKIHTLLNEIQMQLYDCDLNKLREGRGELPINSVWFWGLGPLPEDFAWEWSVVFSEDLFVRGLATITGTPFHPVPADLQAVWDECDVQDSALIVLPHCQTAAQYQNMTLWQEAVEGLEQDWFEPFLDCLKQRSLHTLRIITEGHVFEIGRFGIWRFWRRSRPLDAWRSS